MKILVLGFALGILLLAGNANASGRCGFKPFPPYAADSKKKLKWDELLIEADIDESTTSRFRDMFKDSKIKELIASKDGYVWFADK